MSSQRAADASPAGEQAETATQTAPQYPPTPPPPHQKVVKLLHDLDDLLPANSAERFRELWEELKTEVARLAAAAQTAADNNQIKKLTEAVTALVKKQKQN